jgi:hypothetical protein
MDSKERQQRIGLDEHGETKAPSQKSPQHKIVSAGVQKMVDQTSAHDHCKEG